jgi:hypothetical protein
MVQAAADTVKFALVAPAATLTLAGTVAMAGLLLESAISAPSAGVAAVRVTVPVDRVPPEAFAGLRLSDETVSGGGVTVSTADLLAPYVPEIVTEVATATELEEIVNLRTWRRPGRLRWREPRRPRGYCW